MVKLFKFVIIIARAFGDVESLMRGFFYVSKMITMFDLLVTCRIFLNDVRFMFVILLLILCFLDKFFTETF